MSNNSINPNDSRTLQFELWQECNNHCDFCYLGKENRNTSDDVKIASLQRTIETISDMSNYPKYNCIGYIGGEFFQGQLKNPHIKDLFYQLIKNTADLYNSGVLRQVWISATLTIGDQVDLYNVLKYFNSYDGIWIITSWDTFGRFKSDKMLRTWEFHVSNLIKTFPNLHINVTTILTGDLIDKYLRGDFTFQQMIDKYHISFFFKQCGALVSCSGSNHDDSRRAKIESNKILPNFFPTRRNFLKFLSKFRSQESDNMWTRLFNIQYRADNLVRNYNDGSEGEYVRYKNDKAEDLTFKQMNCGHPFAYAAYIDSDGCCLCDKEKIASLYG